MKYFLFVVSALPAQAMAVYPVMLFKEEKFTEDEAIIRHEMIHFRQQLELLLIPFYVLYLFFYLINLLIYRNHHLAYSYICFEREAYVHDADPDYLNNRKWYGWFRFLKTRS